MNMNYIKEACVETLKQAIRAEKAGADRIELCANLDIGGITPSFELIREVKERVSIPIRIMIRPRGGDFIYSQEEIRMMKMQIEYCKTQSIEGVVFGVLKRDNTLDVKTISELAKVAFPIKVTIHKAIDETPNIMQALEQLLMIDSVTTILTSGGKTTAEEGKKTLRGMIELAQEKLEIMPAGSITTANVARLHEFVNAKAYHGKRIVCDFYD